MTVLKKSFETEIKADESDSGIVEAIVSTYDKDSIGDRVIPGAFKNTLAKWEESGDKIPFIFSHKHDDPDAYLGDILEAKETDDGLWVKAQMDLDHPPSKRVYDLLKARRIKQFSFAYEVKDGEPVREKDDEGNVVDEYYALKEMDLYEAGPTLIGCNQSTRLLGAKRDEIIGTEVPDNSVKCDHCDGKGIVPAKLDEPKAKSDEQDSVLTRLALMELDTEDGE